MSNTDNNNTFKPNTSSKRYQDGVACAKREMADDAWTVRHALSYMEAIRPATDDFDAGFDAAIIEFARTGSSAQERAKDHLLTVAAFGQSVTLAGAFMLRNVETGKDSSLIAVLPVYLRELRQGGNWEQTGHATFKRIK